MPNNTTAARASDIDAAHTEANTEKAHIELALPEDHLNVIILLFPSLPEACQHALRVNVEALIALAT